MYTHLFATKAETCAKLTAAKNKVQYRQYTPVTAENPVQV